MILSDLSPVTFSDALPAQSDIVVIGGGIIGVATAWHLAKAGVSVTVCEKGRVAGEQSSRNWGWVRQQGRDEAELPVMMESNRIWNKLAEEIGVDIGYRQRGVIYTAESEAEMEEHAEWVELAARYDLKSSLLSADEIRRRIPGFLGNWFGGVITESDGRAEPTIVVSALARDCQRKAVSVIENCAVRNVDFSAGRVSGVITEQGYIRCLSVVCAGGAWSSLFMANAGFSFPQLTVRSTVARTAPVADFYSGNVACGDFALRRRQDGGYTIAPCISEHLLNGDSIRYIGKFAPAFLDVWQKLKLGIGSDAPGGLWPQRKWSEDQVSPFEKVRVLNPLPAKTILTALKKRLVKRLPHMENIELEESWSGMIDATPDVVPVMDQLDKFPGLYLASGFSGHGFGIGPAVGRIMADLVQGNPIGHDLTRFRASRFSDGSPLIKGPSL